MNAPALKFHLYIILFVTILISCNGVDDGGSPLSKNNYYITFKANGSQVDLFKSENGATIVGTLNVVESDETDRYESAFSAATADQKATFTILIGTVEEVQTNTIYTNYSSTAPRHQPELFAAAYSADVDNHIFGTINLEQLELIDGVKADTELVFTEVTSTTLSGTFKGTWYNFEDNNASMLITEGSFKVPRL